MTLATHHDRRLGDRRTDGVTAKILRTVFAMRRGFGNAAEEVEAKSLTPLRLLLGEWSDNPPVLRPVLAPGRPLLSRVTRERRRHELVFDFRRVAGDDPYPRPAARGERGEGHHIVLDHGVWAELIQDFAQPLVHVARAIGQRLERGGDEAL